MNSPIINCSKINKIEKKIYSLAIQNIKTILNIGVHFVLYFLNN